MPFAAAQEARPSSARITSVELIDPTFHKAVQVSTVQLPERVIVLVSVCNRSPDHAYVLHDPG